MGPVNLLLDTCAFIWLALPGGKLSAEATRLLNHRSTNLFMSDASLWEICLKHSIGKLKLPGAPRQWLPSRMAFFQTQSLAISQNAIIRSGELPRVHADPFDRLLAAQAIESGMTILSPDTPFSLLGASRLW
jgi:PIN domain nuclease of toxin-antitoxin system